MLNRAGLFAGGRTATEKSAHDWVTVWDHRSEEAVLETLAKLSPGVPVLAEERGGALGRTMWAVDPLDGTRNFTRGMPVVAVSVGLLEDGEPAAGAVVAPYLGLEFWGASGRGAWRNGDRLPSRGPLHAASALVATGFPFRRRERRDRYLSVFDGALSAFEDLRRAGAAALDLAWSAAGTFDGFFELGLSPWDMLAGAVLVRETGGVVTDWEGGPGWFESGDIIAGHPAVHELLVELAAKAPQG